jgi:hypothetical protein
MLAPPWGHPRQKARTRTALVGSGQSGGTTSTENVFQLKVRHYRATFWISAASRSYCRHAKASPNRRRRSACRDCWRDWVAGFQVASTGLSGKDAAFLA